MYAWNNETSWSMTKSVVSTSNQELSSRAPNLHLLFASKIFALWLGIPYTRERDREHRLHGCGNGKSESSSARENNVGERRERVSRGGGQFCASCTQRKQLQRPGGINKDFTGTNYRRFSAVLRRIPRWRKRQLRNARPRLLASSWQRKIYDRVARRRASRKDSDDLRSGGREILRYRGENCRCEVDNSSDGIFDGRDDKCNDLSIIHNSPMIMLNICVIFLYRL